jgi:uncharacterized protein (DUF2252 family)
MSDAERVQSVRRRAHAQVAVDGSDALLGEQRFFDEFTKDRPSLAERLEAGRTLRKSVPRSAHSAYAPDPQRPDPVAVLIEQNKTRIQALVPIRNARMLVSPFSFLRGAAAIMARDLWHTPSTGLLVAACGDMHVSNFGLFGSAERNLVFAINDFDEVHPGPWEWDLKRLAASIALVATSLGGNRRDAETSVRRAVEIYRQRIARYAQMAYLETWYDCIDERSVLAVLPPALRRGAEENMDKARAKGRLQSLDRLTEEVGGEHRIIEDIPLIVREEHLESGVPLKEALEVMLRTYVASLPEDRRRLFSRYRIVDAARKTVGVGSVGTGCWVILLQGLDSEDPLFLQAKQATQSVLAPFTPTPLHFKNQGQRVVVGQRLTQGSPDIFLGWGNVDGTDFYVRQLADMKGGVKFTDGDRSALAGLPEYCGLCGWALALAHAKSGDPAMIAGYCGKSSALDEAIAKFAMAYMEQTELDHAALVEAARKGRISVSQPE